jgi:energy-coupling factor transporter ATP-binding protein EcfA2
MITDLEIGDYQSLHSLSLELGRLTVITGPSSSGKSATIRALRLLAFNARGTSYIRQGAPACSVSVGIADGDTGSAVAIQRGARGKDAYFLAPKDGTAPQKFTKLAGKVPDDVAALLNLSDINFADQFDRPYLLTDSAGEVARKLGELTNVTLLFSAARLANTRRQRLAQQLSDTREELAALTEQAQRFRGLQARQKAAEAAWEAWQVYQETVTRATQLQGLVSRYEKAMVVPPLPAVPDTETLDKLSAQRSRLVQLLLAHSTAVEHAEQMAGRITLAKDDQKQAEQQRERVLQEAGICPTCGQTIERHDS